jgi:hypothetical protein
LSILFGFQNDGAVDDDVNMSECISRSISPKFRHTNKRSYNCSCTFCIWLVQFLLIRSNLLYIILVIIIQNSYQIRINHELDNQSRQFFSFADDCDISFGVYVNICLQLFAVYILQQSCVRYYCCWQLLLCRRQLLLLVRTWVVILYNVTETECKTQIHELPILLLYFLFPPRSSDLVVIRNTVASTNPYSSHETVIHQHTIHPPIIAISS